MWALLARLIGLVLYIGGLIYLTQRNCENPVRHEGEFIRSSRRIINVVQRVALPLLAPMVLMAFWGYIPLYDQLIGPLEGVLGTRGLLSWLVRPLTLVVTLLATSVPSVLTILIWLWILELRPSLPIRVLLALPLIGVFGLSILYLRSGIRETGSLLSWVGQISSYDWVLPFLLASLGPPLFLVYMLHHWPINLLPVNEDERNRRLAAQYLVGFFSTLPKPTHVVEDGELKTRIEGHIFLGVEPGLIITEPENIVAVRSSRGFRRFVGPGAQFIGIGPADIPYEVVDLQKQFRLTRIEALTRDGVRISVPCSSMFRIDAGKQKVKLGEPWPYRERAAYLALHGAKEVNPTRKTFLDEKEAVSWKELPLRTATLQLKQLVAGYTLDELYASKRAYPLSTLPRKDITTELRSYVREKMSKVGIRVLGGGVGAKLQPLDKEVTQQRVDTWKAGWAEKLELQEGRATAAYLREAERVRINILNELFDLARRLGESSMENKKALLAARLLEMLENIARSPGMERLIPESYYEQVQRLSFGDSQSDQEEV